MGIPLPEPLASPPIALTIAGFDPSGGAGITADLAVFAAHGLYGTAAVSIWTAQSTLGVAATRQVDAGFLAETLDVLYDDLRPAAIKIGALGNGQTADTVGKFLKRFEIGPSAEPPAVRVFDPVLVSSSGRELFEPEGLHELLAGILPHVAWITPNWQELAVLSGQPVGDADDVWRAMELLGQRYPMLSIVATGGDQDAPVDRVRLASGQRAEIGGERIASTATHGTGCAFSSALLCRLVAGEPALAAVRAAKRYVEEGIRRAPHVGTGKGPLDLLWPLRS